MTAFPLYMDHILIDSLLTCVSSLQFPMVNCFLQMTNIWVLFNYNFTDQYSLISSGNFPWLWLDVYCTPLIPMHSEYNVTWVDEDFQIHALHFVSKWTNSLSLQLCGIHCITGYSIYNLVIFPFILIVLLQFCVVCSHTV